MIQLIRLQRDTFLDSHKTGSSIQQTPIEKVISELEKERSHYSGYDEPITGLDIALRIVKTLLPYEKKRDRNIAEKAWDECEEATIERVGGEVSHQYLRSEKDKQTYLKQNRPL